MGDFFYRIIQSIWIKSLFSWFKREETIKLPENRSEEHNNMTAPEAARNILDKRFRKF
tara:strand:+ start:896 stop:1069 length:174 start_codon:yes stop_codon:yes gene_type:complete